MSKNSTSPESSVRFLKLIMCKDTDWLQENYPNAFLLLIQIAKTARRTTETIDDLKIGDAKVGEIETSKKAGLSTKEYRNALKKLEELKYIETVFNPRSTNHQKRAIKGAIKCKVVNLIDSSVCDINAIHEGDQKGEEGAIKGRRTRKNKKEEEYHHPNPSSSKVVKIQNSLIDDDDSLSIKNEKPSEVKPNSSMQHNVYYQVPSQSSPKLTPKPSPKVEVIPGEFLTQIEYEKCIAYMKSHENLCEIMTEINNWPGREFKIKNWFETIVKWKKSHKPKIALKIIENEERTKRLEKNSVENNTKWLCIPYKDTIKDDRGILFYLSEGAESQTIFISYSDPEFNEKVDKTLRDKKMQQSRLSKSLINA